MTASTAPTATNVVTLAISNSLRTRAIAAAASGSNGLSELMRESELKRVTIPAEADGSRLDRALAAQVPALSRSRLKALILSGQVAVEGRTVSDPSAEVKSGQSVTIALPPPEPAKPQGEAIPLSIVYEDDALIVIDK